MKKGFSLVTLLVTIFVIITLTSTIVISANSIYNSNKKIKFASEISYIKELVNNYMADNNGKLPSSSDVVVSTKSISKEDLNTQFAGESISEDTIFLNKIDMSMINPGTLQYGNGTEEKSDDIYCISKKTGRIYYARGCKIGSKTYYTLTDELKKAIKYTESNNINDGIIFCDGNLESGIKEIDIKIPDSYLDVELTSTDVSFEYSSKNQSGYNIYKTKSKENSTITVKYKVNSDSEKKELKYNVEGVDNSGLTFSLSDVKKSINSSTQKEEKYVTIENISKEDSKIKIKKYANIYVNEEEAKNYFKNNGIEVKDNIVNIDNSLAGNITVYIEDKSGIYHIEYIRLGETNILDYVGNGLVLLLDGIENTRGGHSASTNVWEDLSGNNYDTGNISLGTETYWDENNMVFNNTNKMILISDSNKNTEILNTINSNQFTVQFFVNEYTKSNDNYSTILWSTNDDFAFYSYTSQSIFYLKNSNNSRTTIPISSVIGKTVTISFDLNNKTLKLYSDTDKSSEVTISETIKANNFNIGRNSIHNNFSIGEIRIYNRILTEKEINHNYMVDKARYGIK